MLFTVVFDHNIIAIPALASSDEVNSTTINS